jgi:hypothetical protein
MISLCLLEDDDDDEEEEDRRIVFDRECLDVYAVELDALIRRRIEIM